MTYPLNSCLCLYELYKANKFPANTKVQYPFSARNGFSLLLILLGQDSGPDSPLSSGRPNVISPLGQYVKAFATLGSTAAIKFDPMMPIWENFTPHHSTHEPNK